MRNKTDGPERETEKVLKYTEASAVVPEGITYCMDS